MKKKNTPNQRTNYAIYVKKTVVVSVFRMILNDIQQLKLKSHQLPFS